jgi:hypothetical protein
MLLMRNLPARHFDQSVGLDNIKTSPKAINIIILTEDGTAVENGEAMSMLSITSSLHLSCTAKNQNPILSPGQIFLSPGQISNVLY